MTIKAKAVKKVGSRTAKPVGAKSMKQVKKKVVKSVKAKKAKKVTEEAKSLAKNAKQVKADAAKPLAENTNQVNADVAKPVEAEKAKQLEEEVKPEEIGKQVKELEPKGKEDKPVKAKKVNKVKKMTAKEKEAKPVKAKKVKQVKKTNPQEEEDKPVTAKKVKQVKSKAKKVKKKAKQVKKKTVPSAENVQEKASEGVKQPGKKGKNAKQIGKKGEAPDKAKRPKLVVNVRPNPVNVKKAKLLKAKKERLAKAKAEMLKGKEVKLPTLVSQDNVSLEDELEEGSRIAQAALTQALEGLRVLDEQRRSEKGKKKDLLEDDQEDTSIFLQVGILKLAKTLPHARHVIRPVKIKISLPNPTVTSNTDVLVITKDAEDGKDIRDDHSENLYHYQELLRRCGAARHITEVVTLRQLKTEYKEYEAKRSLAKRTDIVLCDDTIFHRIHMFLGRNFCGPKAPRPVNLKAQNLLEEVEGCLNMEVLNLSMAGNSSIMKIGRLGQTNEMMIENIRATVRAMQEKFPGGWENVQGLYLKTEKSESIPFYVKLRSSNDVKAVNPRPLSSRPFVTGEVSSSYGDVYTVCPNNNIIFSRKYSPYLNKLDAKREKRELEEAEELKKALKEEKKKKNSLVNGMADGETTGTKRKALKRKKSDEAGEVQVAKKKKNTKNSSAEDVTAKKKKKTKEDIAGKKKKPAKDIAAKKNKSVKDVPAKKKKLAKDVAAKKEKVVKKVAAKNKKPANDVAAKEKKPVKDVAAKEKKPVKDVAAKKKNPVKDVVTKNKSAKDIAAKKKNPVKAIATKNKPAKDIAAKKSKKSKKSKRLGDMDFDSDDEQLDRMEREYLKNLSAEREENVAGGKAMADWSDDEEDDWAEGSDEGMSGMEDDIEL